MTCRRAELASLALFSAAALPLLVAITQIGFDSGTMRKEVGLSLIGAGMLSVLVYPLLALIVHRRAEGEEPPAAAATSSPAAS